MIGDLTMKVKSFHEQYGDTVRVTPNQLSFNGTQAWRDIYGHRSGKRQLQRDPGFYIKDSSGIPNIINADDESHNRIRKLLSHAFSEKAMREEEPLITKYFDLLIRKLHEQVEGTANGKVDIVNWYNFTTFDIIGDLSFGVPFGSLENGVLHFWIGNIFKGVKVGRIIRLGLAYPWLGSIMSFLMKQFPQVAEARAKHEQFSHGSVEKRLAMKTDRKDFMTYVLRNNDKNGMTEAEIKETFSIILIAGSEPVASVLSGATYYLLRNKDALQKVTNEIRKVFKSEEEINFTSVGQLRYLHAVIEESLRMYPPVPGTLLRLTPPEGDLINGHAVPGNVSQTSLTVSMKIVLLKNHRHPSASINGLHTKPLITSATPKNSYQSAGSTTHTMRKTKKPLANLSLWVHETVWGRRK